MVSINRFNPVLNSETKQASVPVITPLPEKKNHDFSQKDQLQVFSANPKNQIISSLKIESDTPKELLTKINDSESEEKKYDLLASYLKQNNHPVDNLPERRNIVAFRQPNLPSENNSKGVYDDKTFVFWQEKDGTKKVREFVSNTDPNGLYTLDRPNGDFGRIVAGKTYSFGFSTSTNYGNVLRPIGKLEIERYSKTDNQFKPAKTSLDVDRTFLFHSGQEKQFGTFSMGCQTFPAYYESNTNKYKETFTDFWQTMRGDEPKNRQKQINYTIIELKD